MYVKTGALVKAELPGRLAALAATLFLGVFLLYPLWVILARSFAGADIGAALALLTSDITKNRLWFTISQAGLSTLGTIVIGVPVGVLFARRNFPGKQFLLALFTVQFVLPNVVVAAGFLVLLGPNGLLGVNMRNTLAIILIAHIFFNFAIIARSVHGFLAGRGLALERAAAMLGAGPLRRFWRVTLPAALPAIFASSLLVFLFCFTSFGIILILAPQPIFGTLEVEIYRLSARLFRLDLAGVLVVLQLLVALIVSVVYTRLQRRFQTESTRDEFAALPSGGTGFFVIGAATLFIAAPLISLLIGALTAHGTFGLSAFRQAFAAGGTLSYRSFGHVLGNSLQFAALSALLATTVGLVFAYAVVRGKQQWLDTLSLLPLATSPVTLGFGYLLAYPGLVTTAWGIPLAHTLIAFPFVARTLIPALRAQPKSLPSQAALLGASAWRRLWRIDVPLLIPALRTSFIFAVAISFGEFGASLLLLRPEYATLPAAIYSFLNKPGAGNYAIGLALAVVLMVVVGGIMLLLGGRRRQGEFV